MDTLTHMALGACIGQAIGYKKMGRKALVYGAFAAFLPDLDVLATPFLGDYGSWKYHRHLSHALWFVPLIGAVLATGLWRFYERKNEKQQGVEFGRWLAVMVLAILSHPLLDFCTIYGTQLFAPFSNHRFEISAISIIDPVYSGILCLAMGALLFRKGRERARFLAVSAIALTTTYIAMGWGLNMRAENLAARQLDDQQIAYQKVEAFTTIFQPFLRRVVVTEPHQVRVGFVSTFRPQEIHWACQAQVPDAVKTAILATYDGGMLSWFSNQTVGFATGNAPDLVVASDLRYGMPGPSAFGWWGQIYKTDGDGGARYIGKLQVDRDSSWHAITGLFRAAYGMENDFLLKSDQGCDAAGAR